MVVGKSFSLTSDSAKKTTVSVQKNTFLPEVETSLSAEVAEMGENGWNVAESPALLQYRSPRMIN